MPATSSLKVNQITAADPSIISVFGHEGTAGRKGHEEEEKEEEGMKGEGRIKGEEEDELDKDERRKGDAETSLEKNVKIKERKKNKEVRRRQSTVGGVKRNQIEEKEDKKYNKKGTVREDRQHETSRWEIRRR